MTFYNRRLICRRSTLTHVSMNNGGENEDLACHSDGEAGSSGTLFKERSNLLDTVSNSKHRSSMIDGQLATAPLTKSSRRVSVRKLLFERINAPPRLLGSLGNCGEQSSSKNIFDDCEKTLSSIYSSRSSSICSNVSSRRDSLNVKKDGTFYRTMWKKLAMDLSRKNCKINYASSKLMYDEMPIMDSEASATKELVATWEHILNSGQGVDKREIQSAVKNGVPKHLRGRIWKLLVQKRTICQAPEYEDLLMEECPFQHAILVDLGRTFPSHPYFGTSFCPGQLSLMYVLKAYAVFDQEIGYCQGLSFVAGMLLLHMEEKEAFTMLCHLMYDLNFRDRYRPDMLTLQTEMYIFSRLLFEKQPALHQHLEKYSVPILYTAPWFLTLFANAFPMGFVARVFDFIFYTGDVDVVFRIALQLLAVNERVLIEECRSFESIDDFLKNKLPLMCLVQTEKIFDQICDMEISREILTYKVEYGVLKDEVYNNNNEDFLPKAVYNSLFVTNSTFEDELVHAYKKISILQHQKQNLECKLNKAIQMVNRFKTRFGKAVDEKECQLKELFDM